MAQSVQSAEDLLELCAWNIYPDNHAIGARATTIQQKDTLVAKGGVLTIRLRNTGQVGPTGVSWSMLLTHLRFYGKQVMSLASIGSASSRVPLIRGMHVLLGIFTSEWRSSHVDLAKLARFMISFADSLQAAVRNILDNRKATPESPNQELFNLRRLLERDRTFADFESVVYWPRMLSLQSQMYLQSSENE